MATSMGRSVVCGELAEVRSRSVGRLLWFCRSVGRVKSGRRPSIVSTFSSPDSWQKIISCAKTFLQHVQSPLSKSCSWFCDLQIVGPGLNIEPFLSSVMRLFTLSTLKIRRMDPVHRFPLLSAPPCPIPNIPPTAAKPVSHDAHNIRKSNSRNPRFRTFEFERRKANTRRRYRSPCPVCSSTPWNA